MNKTIHYQTAVLADIPEILELIRYSKLHYHPGKEVYVDNFVSLWGPNAYYVEDNLLLKALEGENLVGIIGLRAPNASRDFAELDLLFVASACIGQGYGRLLWNQILQISQEQQWPSLRFLSDNLPQVIGFYEYLGAKRIETIALEDGDFPLMEYSCKV